MRKFEKITFTKKFNQEKGGIYEKPEQVSQIIDAILLPLSEKELKILDDGAKIEDFQKIYTNGETLTQNEYVKDLASGIRYKVTKDLNYNSFHTNFKRYVVERTETGDNT